MRIRPVRPEDHPQLLELAKEAGIGMLSLPPDPAALEKKIDHSVRSFAGNPPRPNEERFLFVMEDTETGKLAGSTGIISHVGLYRPFYTYKLSTIVQASRDLDIYSEQKVLHMVNDYTGVSEIGSLFLSPAYRKDGLGRLLSRCRYLLVAEYPDIFSDIVIAEIRGISDENGDAPFYDHLARHFFHMSFAEADMISATRGNQFIADLMPKYPIYVNLLPEEAQAAIGAPLPASAPAMQLLIREGFRYEGYVDVFDGGPTMQAQTQNIRAIAQSQKAKVTSIADHSEDGPPFMICNTKLDQFIICRDALKVLPDNTAVITRATAEKLEIGEGDDIRFTPT